jgi:hypothetical protein
MASFDFERLTAALRPACEKTFGELLAKHAMDLPYCVAVFTSGDLGYLLPTMMTESGLASTVEAYRRNPSYRDEGKEALSLALRWNPCDSPLHLIGEEAFRGVQDVVDDVREVLHSIDTDQGRDEFQDFWSQIIDVIAGVLAALDRNGLFGLGAERERLFVAIMMGDQDDSVLEIGRRLNPAKSYARFRADWDRLRARSE